MNAEGAYIEEIILVDDSSTMENLGEKLEIALSYFKKPMVKLIRNFERMGLIQRWEGARDKVTRWRCLDLDFPSQWEKSINLKNFLVWSIQNSIFLISRFEHKLSRLAGASMAEGDILLFMDSHCECYPNWLVPLIQHVACDRTSIAVPGNHIDAVSNYLI